MMILPHENGSAKLEDFAKNTKIKYKILRQMRAVSGGAATATVFFFYDSYLIFSFAKSA